MGYIDINQTDELVNKLGVIHKLSSFGIAFVGNNSSQIIRYANSSPEKWIVLHAIENASTVEDIPAHDYLNNPASRKIAAPKSEQSSDLKVELYKMGWSCGMLALAGIATAITAGAAPVTAGQSLWLTSITAAGSVASAYQCGDSAGRVINEIISPDRNDVLDSDELYTGFGILVDGIGTVSSIVSGGAAIKGVIGMGKISKRPAWQLLKKYGKRDQRLFARELSKKAGIARSNNHFKKLKKEGSVVSSYSNTQIHKAVVEQLIDAVTNAISTGCSSSINSVYVYLVKNN